MLLIITTVFKEYKLLFEGAGSNPGDKTLEDRFFEHEVRCMMGYAVQFDVILASCLCFRLF